MIANIIALLIAGTLLGMLLSYAFMAWISEAVARLVTDDQSFDDCGDGITDCDCRPASLLSFHSQGLDHAQR